MDFIAYFVAMIQRIILFVVFFFVVFSSTSQEYFMQNYSMKNGLPNNQLHNIIQASDNTLWFTTFRGLCQFDGASFSVLTEEDGLISNHILNIFEDSKGRIWISPWGRKGLNIIENGKITTPKDSVLNERWAMITAHEDAKGRIWFFGNKTVIKYENNKFELIYKSKDDKDYLHPNKIAVINDNELYVTQLENGVIKVTLEPFKIEHINNESHGINNICYSAFKDSEGKYWFGCYGGIYSFENNKMTFHQIPIEFNKCRVWDIDEDQEGNLWIATYGGGVVKWDKKDEFTVLNSKHGLVDNLVYSVLVDKENNKWITTDIGGLIKLKDFSFEYFTKNSGLKSDHVYGVSQLKNGNVVLGTEKGFSIVKNNKIDTTIYQDFNVTFLANKNDTLWYTSKTGYGVLKDNYELTNFDKFNRSDFIHPKQNLVGGLSRILHNNKEIFYDEFLIIPTAFYLNNKLFIGTNYGLLNYENGHLSQIKNLESDIFPEILTSQNINENEVLVTNPNELVYMKYIGDSLEIKRFSRSKLGGVTHIFCVLLDGNDLWLSGQNMLAKVNFKELIQHNRLIITKYDSSSGYIRSQNSAGAIFKDNTGSIWIGTSEGAVKFNEKLIKKNKVPPVLKFKNIYLFSRLFDDKNFKNEGKIEFPFDKNHISFDLQAISLSKPEKILCKYRLVGLSDKWSYAVPIQKVSYPFLNPGAYTFEFMASNGEGVWTKKSMKYSFVILPPYWKTWWFYSIVSLSFLMLILSLFYLQKKKADKKQLNQEKFTQNIIKAQEEERKRISKGLHDGIGQNLLLIKNALLTNKVDGAKNMVSTTIEEVRTISRNLHPFQLEKFGLTKALESMIEELDQSFDNIIFTEEIDVIDGLFSKEEEINVYRIVQECINNIIKHANASAVRIVVQKRKKNIEITVFDNGKGFDLEKNKDIINSLGLKSIRERVKYLKGTVNFESKINAGTKISIKIAYEPR